MYYYFFPLIYECLAIIIDRLAAQLYMCREINYFKIKIEQK